MCVCECVCGTQRVETRGQASNVHAVECGDCPPALKPLLCSLRECVHVCVRTCVRARACAVPTHTRVLLLSSSSSSSLLLLLLLLLLLHAPALCLCCCCCGGLSSSSWTARPNRLRRYLPHCARGGVHGDDGADLAPRRRGGAGECRHDDACQVPACSTNAVPSSSSSSSNSSSSASTGASTRRGRRRLEEE